MPVWSGCQEFLISALQICQNKAARVVVNKDFSTPVAQLLKECGWRSVRQEMFYLTVLQVHKTLKIGAPVYLFNKLTEDGQYQRDTRQARGSTIRQGPSFQTKLGFRWRGATCYERIPSSIRNEPKLGKFKKRLNEWVKSNIFDLSTV